MSATVRYVGAHGVRREDREENPKADVGLTLDEAAALLDRLA